MKQGFTLVELIISIAIFAVMTALIIARYGNFNQATILTNMAYDMALTVRTAQTYGLSVKSTTGDIYSSAYGVHFDMSNPTQFLFFTDTNQKGQYVAGSGEDITTYTLTNGAKISSICLSNTYESGTCNSGTPISSNGEIDITYRRPNPNAYFDLYTTTNSTGTFDTTNQIVLINVVSSDGTHTETVVVRKNGQISVGQ